MILYLYSTIWGISERIVKNSRHGIYCCGRDFSTMEKQHVVPAALTYYSTQLLYSIEVLIRSLFWFFYKNKISYCLWGSVKRKEVQSFVLKWYVNLTDFSCLSAFSQIQKQLQFLPLILHHWT